MNFLLKMPFLQEHVQDASSVGKKAEPLNINKMY